MDRGDVERLGHEEGVALMIEGMRGGKRGCWKAGA